MEQIELEITDQIMRLLREVDVSFYQRELSYSHCEVVDLLENIKEEGIAVCNRDYLIPLLEVLKRKNEIYYVKAANMLLHQICLQRNLEIANPDVSAFEQLCSWVTSYIFMYQNQENVDFEKSTMLKQFVNQLASWIEDPKESKMKQKQSSNGN